MWTDHKMKRIVVTGIGPIASVGIGKEFLWEGLMKRDIGLEQVETLIVKELWDKFYVHKVKNFDISDFDIDQDSLDYIRNWKGGEDNKDLLFLLAAVKLALEDSKINYKLNKNELGLVITHENPGLEQLLWKSFRSSYQLFKNFPSIQEQEFCNKLYSEIIKAGYETQSFMFLFHIARTFNVHNYSLFLNNACASGLYAIEAARDMINLGKAKQVVVAASDCPDIFKHLWFKMINMYAIDGKIKPFANDSHGFVLGEGATALVLEDFEHAQNRNANIYAEYLGGGFNLEVWGVTSPMIGSNFYQESIKAALENSKINKNEVDLICAHAVGTSASDYYEAKAIKEVFPKNNVPVVALKPYIGHNLGGSTLIELAILLLCMEKKTILPILNTSDVSPNIDLPLVLEQRDCDLKTILKICAAFAGYNASVVFRRFNK